MNSAHDPMIPLADAVVIAGAAMVVTAALMAWLFLDGRDVDAADQPVLEAYRETYAPAIARVSEEDRFTAGERGTVRPLVWLGLAALSLMLIVARIPDAIVRAFTYDRHPSNATLHEVLDSDDDQDEDDDAGDEKYTGRHRAGARVRTRRWLSLRRGELGAMLPSPEGRLA